MKQQTHQLSIATQKMGLYNISREIEGWVDQQGMQTGVLTVFIPHTSASLIIQENADPDVIQDLNAFFSRLVPEGDTSYRHTTEGPDDMPAHIRSSLTQTQLSIPLVDGQLALGVWQGIYIFEHRDEPHKRNVVLHLLGE